MAESRYSSGEALVLDASFLSSVFCPLLYVLIFWSIVKTLTHASTFVFRVPTIRDRGASFGRETMRPFFLILPDGERSCTCDVSPIAPFSPREPGVILN